MNQDRKSDRGSIETPPPKRVRTECPQAPIKTRPDAESKDNHIPLLTPKQVKQLQENWKKHSEETLDGQ